MAGMKPFLYRDRPEGQRIVEEAAARVRMSKAAFLRMAARAAALRVFRDPNNIEALRQSMEEPVPAGQLAEEDEDHPLRWGPWRLDPQKLSLYTEYGGTYYEISLETCTTAAEVLDWICQIHGKDWPVEGVAHLVAALDDLLQPQRTLIRGQLTRRQIKSRIEAYAKGAESS
jgi:hypothetical protein